MQQQKKKSVKDLFSFSGQKMLLRENGRLDRNMKLLEILPYVLTHIGTYGSLWNNTVNISRILWRNWGKDELKMKKEKRENRENSGDVIQKLCEVGDTSSNKKLWEDLEESRERKITLSDES